MSIDIIAILHQIHMILLRMVDKPVKRVIMVFSVCIYRLALILCSRLWSGNNLITEIVLPETEKISPDKNQPYLRPYATHFAFISALPCE